MAPGRLRPEDAAWVGMRGIGIPPGGGQRENLPGSIQGSRVPCGQILLNFC